jgi:hypothetical protein
LPEDSQWRDKKYDAAYTVQLMSDDEVGIDAEGKKRSVFISCAPTYRAEIVSLRQMEVTAAYLC